MSGAFGIWRAGSRSKNVNVNVKCGDERLRAARLREKGFQKTAGEDRLIVLSEFRIVFGKWDPLHPSYMDQTSRHFLDSFGCKLEVMLRVKKRSLS